MSSSAVYINSVDVSSGDTFNGLWNFTNDFTGYFKVLYNWLDDGNIPIVYDGCNAVLVYKTDTPNNVQKIYMDDLNSDVPADIINWFTSSFAQLTAKIGVNFVSATQEPNGSYTVDFDSSVTFLFGDAVSNLAYVFGFNNLAGSSINFPNENLNSRPKFIGFNISQASQINTFNNNTNIKILMSTKDDLLVGNIVYFANEQSQLNISVIRLNAPFAVCPMTLDWAIVLQVSSL